MFLSPWYLTTGEEDAGHSNTVDAFEPYVKAMLHDLVRFGYVRNGKDSKHFKYHSCVLK
jgi:hypothetical protein